MSPQKQKLFEILLITFCLLNTISLIFGKCVIRLPDDFSTRPNFLLKIGSRKIDVVLSKADTEFVFFDNQEVEAECDIKFQLPNFFNQQRKINFKCENRKLSAPELDYYTNYNDEVFMCSSDKWNLYEMDEQFVWCPPNTNSYLLARPKDLEITKFHYLAGICYDTFSFSFKSLYYSISPKYSEHMHPNKLYEFDTPGLEIKYLKETFHEKSVSQSNYDGQEFKDWIIYSQYNYSPIIQNTLLLDEFNDQLGSLLDVAWWPSLRLGNWKHYERALSRHIESEDQSYDVISGISSILTVPIIETCQTNYTLKQLTDNKNKNIPMYVWNYLRPSGNNSDEVVIIGVNSPFFEFYEEKEVIFCADKCQEIHWLKKISTTFRYSALGIIFCCSSEDVRATKRLDGFPDVYMDSVTRMEETSTRKSISNIEYE